MRVAHNALNLLGMTFGKLTVISREPNKFEKTMWLCKCSCGKTTVSGGSTLKNGKAKSCGCSKTEAIIRRSTTHGRTNSREYRIWQAMLTRCRNTNQPAYINYGGRGITVCERWNDFSNFIEDMGQCPKGHSIEREDTNGNYEPSNCKWASRHEQSRNKRNNVFLEFRGERLCLKDWAVRIGIDQASLRQRLKTWTIEKSLTTLKRQK